MQRGGRERCHDKDYHWGRKEQKHAASYISDQRHQPTTASVDGGFIIYAFSWVLRVRSTPGTLHDKGTWDSLVYPRPKTFQAGQEKEKKRKKKERGIFRIITSSSQTERCFFFDRLILEYLAPSASSLRCLQGSGILVDDVMPQLICNTPAFSHQRILLAHISPGCP